MNYNSDYSKTIRYSKIVDLSHIIDTQIPRWPSDPPIEFKTVSEIGKEGYYLRHFSMGEHSGTHINSPKSFYPQGASIDTYSTSSLVVSAVVIDVQKQAEANADYALTTSDILSWEEEHQRIPEESMVLLYTGWQRKWCNPQAFFNPDAQGNIHFPGFGGESTRFLLEERRIAGVGIDTHGVDPGQDETFATNKQVLEKPGIVLENLTNLDQLPATGTTLVVGILRLRGGSGTPVSVLAFVP